MDHAGHQLAHRLALARVKLPEQLTCFGVLHDLGDQIPATVAEQC